MIYDLQPFLNADYRDVGVACGCGSEPDLVQSCVCVWGGGGWRGMCTGIGLNQTEAAAVNTTIGVGGVSEPETIYDKGMTCEITS